MIQIVRALRFGHKTILHGDFYMLRREAEWFPAYRVFSQPPKCLHQAM